MFSPSATSCGRPRPKTVVHTDKSVMTPFFHAYIAAHEAHGDEPVLPDLRFAMGGGAPLPSDGHVRIVGRLEDTIIRNGENISALEVESALVAIPKIVDIAVVGLPVARGERVCAVVVAKDSRRPSPARRARGGMPARRTRPLQTCRTHRTRQQSATESHGQAGQARHPPGHPGASRPAPRGREFVEIVKTDKISITLVITVTRPRFLTNSKSYSHFLTTLSKGAMVGALERSLR